MDKHPDYKKIEAKAAAGKTARQGGDGNDGDVPDHDGSLSDGLLGSELSRLLGGELKNRQQLTHDGFRSFFK